MSPPGPAAGRGVKFPGEHKLVHGWTVKQAKDAVRAATTLGASRRRRGAHMRDFLAQHGGRRRKTRRTRRRRRRRRTRRRRQKRGGRWSPYNKDWSSLPKNYRVMIQYHDPTKRDSAAGYNATATGNFQLKDNVFKRIGKARDGDGGPDSIEKYRVHSVWFWDDTPRLDDGNYNSQGGRRRTRKQRGGFCASCLAPLMLL